MWLFAKEESTCNQQRKGEPTHHEKNKKINDSFHFYLFPLLTAMPKGQTQGRERRKKVSKCLIPPLEIFGDELLACSKESRKICIECETGIFNRLDFFHN